jgi:rhamnose utilization protein RhaD (predicted bifunctional aldolase and dehydrogenase)
VDLCRALGDPEYAIIGDGNVSARADNGTFWVKASGTSLAEATARDLVQVRTADILAMFDAGEQAAGRDEQVRAALIAAKVDCSPTPLPSIETVMHAALLELEGVCFVGHTHPTAINALTCSVRYEELLRGRIFPEEVVLCGPESLLVHYADPGLALGRLVRSTARRYVREWGEFPRAIYLKNHGFIALGSTAREVVNTTAMAVKAAKIRLGAASLGDLSFLSASDVQRLHRRPDIGYRKRVMGGA